MSRIGGASKFLLVMHNTEGGGGDQNFFRGGSNGVGDPGFPSKKSIFLGGEGSLLV